jgi:hypothetical protein
LQGLPGLRRLPGRLQSLWLRRLRRLCGLRRLLPLVGHLPHLLSHGARCGVSATEDFLGRVRPSTRPILCVTALLPWPVERIFNQRGKC